MDLRELDDINLEKKLLQLTQQERQLTTAILEHLKEVNERKLFAKRGYPSLFSYCTECLRYSEGAASRRIRSMRLLTECPDVRPKISSGEISLSNLSRAAAFFRQEKKLSKTYSSKEKTKVLDSLCGKTQKQAKETFVNLNPQAARIKEIQRLVSPELTELKLTLDKVTTEKLERLKQLKPALSLNDLFSWMLHRSLKQIDPAREPRKRTGLSEKKVSDQVATSTAKSGLLSSYKKSLPQRKREDQLDPKNPTKPNHSKTLRRPLRKPFTRNQKYQVWTQADGCCQFRDSVSKRVCKSQMGLEIDHIQPLILGGADDLSNLRLLCREHHRLQTQNSFK